MKDYIKKVFWIVLFFLAIYFMPIGTPRFDNAVFEALYLAKWYAQEHVLLCLVPAFLIAGAISSFISQGSVIKFFGANSNKILSYGIASISGAILAVCSCTVLPLFASIYKRGAGLGPAIAFLYSGPAINVLAIVLTARILGWQFGVARAIGAILFAIIIGLIMQFVFKNEDKERTENLPLTFSEGQESKPLWQTALFIGSLVAILVFANWAPTNAINVWQAIFVYKWWITALSVIALLIFIKAWYSKYELKLWLSESLAYAVYILPLLLIGVLISGFLLGRVGSEGIIPSKFVAGLVGGNSLSANFFASVIAAFMYFATLTEVPILQGLLNAGMGKGPALALLLAGPALSLPSMLVIRNVMGTRKTIVYVLLVIVMATVSGLIFGAF